MRRSLAQRRETGRLTRVRQTLVVSDLERQAHRQRRQHGAVSTRGGG